MFDLEKEFTGIKLGQAAPPISIQGLNKSDCSVTKKSLQLGPVGVWCLGQLQLVRKTAFNLDIF